MQPFLSRSGVPHVYRADSPFAVPALEATDFTRRYSNSAKR